MIRWLLTRLMKRPAHLESGQALAEYMPTLAGMFALTAVVAWAFTPVLKDSYCEVVDALTDPPGVCDTADPGGNPGDDSQDPVDDPSEDPENEDDDGTCVVSLSGAEGTDPSSWSGEWDGEDDVLTIDVSELEEPISWSLNLSFPTDPDSEGTELNSGEISEPGTYTVNVAYPAEGEWGPVSDDGDGTYEAHAALTLTEPCGDVSWNRWFEAEELADLGITIDHATSPVETDGETLVYNVVVTNHGPYDAEEYEGQGVTVDLPVPPEVTVIDVSPSQGECDPAAIACDLGAIAYGDSVTITVETTVGHVVEECNLTATAEVSSASPEDPNDANNTDTTEPWCELVCEQSVSSFKLVKNNSIVGDLTDGMQLDLEATDEINILANVSGDVGSVEFLMNGSHYSTENISPYALAGDSNGNYNGFTPTAGTYAVTAKPYTESDAGGESCSEYGVSFSVAVEEPETPPGGINDPNQPNGDPYDTCPSSHPTLIKEFDYYATADDLYRAIQWRHKDVNCTSNCSRQAHLHSFTLDGAWDTILMMRGAVGHPESGCPENTSDSLCRRANQDNEHWAVDVDGEQVAFNPDNYAQDHVYMIYPNAELGVLSAGEHSLRMYHPGLLDQPSNSNGPSVGAWLAVCVSDTQ